MDILIDETGVGQRLDRFLTEKLSDHSRTRIRQLIDNEHISVNGRHRPASFKLRGGETIAVHIPDPVPAEAVPENIPLDILYEDSDLLVINKTADMIVHPLPGTQSGTLVNALLYHCKDLSGINGVQRPGIIHRLDKATSGCLVVAKNDTAHRSLAAQFKNRTIHKEYLAVVWGTPDPASGEITTQIGRDTANRTKMSSSPVVGRTAVSKYNLKGVYGPCSIVGIKIITGRTHQIRVHMEHIGHPVVGDETYGGGPGIIGRIPERFRIPGKRCLKRMGRQALHAHTLSFSHPVTKETMSFTAPVPPDLDDLLEFLKKLFPEEV